MHDGSWRLSMTPRRSRKLTSRTWMTCSESARSELFQMNNARTVNCASRRRVHHQISAIIRRRIIRQPYGTMTSSPVHSFQPHFAPWHMYFAAN